MMGMQKSGPVCDVCNKPITGIDGGTMQTWTMPIGLTLMAHEPRCDDGMNALKAATCEALAQDLVTWLRLLMSGSKTTWEEINSSASKAVNEALAAHNATN